MQNKPQSATTSPSSEKVPPTRAQNATAVTDSCNLKGKFQLNHLNAYEEQQMTFK